MSHYATEVCKCPKKIGYGAFYGCTFLKSITFPECLTEIEDYAFAYCSSIECVNLPKSLEKIGELAWGYCSSLSDIALPPNLKETGDIIFAGCKNLTILEPWMVGTWEVSVGSIYSDGLESELVWEISENGQTIESLGQNIRHPNGLVYSYPPRQRLCQLIYDRENRQLLGGRQNLEVSGKSLSIQLTEGGMNYPHCLTKTSD